MKVCVYTVITGNYDKLRQPKVVNPEWDYICFTDQKVSSDIWQIRFIPKEVSELSNVKKQRYIKINHHKVLPEYDLTIYIDASMEIIKDLGELIDINYDFIACKHPFRNCIYDECAAVVKGKRDTIENVNRVYTKYQSENYPAHNGLIETGFMIRKNTPYVNEIMESWWDEVLNYSHRDQLSLNYVLWKQSKTPKIINVTYRPPNKYINLYYHKTDRVKSY